MQRVLPLGALLLLGLAGCSGSPNSIIGPNEDIRPSMDPGSKDATPPHATCVFPGPAGHRVSVSGVFSLRYSAWMETSNASCPRQTAAA